MKTKSTFAVLLVLGVVAIALADKPVAPPKPSALVGAWIGFDEEWLTFYRLELTGDGKGCFADAFLEQKPSLWRVETWELKGFDIAVKLKPVRDAEPLLIKKALYDSRALTLEVGGLQDKWSAKVTLFNEKTWENHASRVKDSVAKLKSGTKTQ